MELHFVYQQDDETLCGEMFTSVAEDKYGIGEGWHLACGTQNRNHQHLETDGNLFLTLCYFQTILKDKHVLVHTDNMGKVFYINHQVGTKSFGALQVAHNLLICPVCLPSSATAGGYCAMCSC